MSAVEAVRGDTSGTQGAGPEVADVGAGHEGPSSDVVDGAAPRSLGWLMAIGGAIGFVAAFVLTVERFLLAENPDYVPSCSLNPVLSCGSVMEQPQAALLGFPNPLLGIAAFAIATTLGVLVASGTALPRWVWLGFQVGITAGMVFVLWLMSQSLYVIGALCPYCMVVWAVVIPMFWSVTATNLERGVIPTPASARGAVTALSDYRLVAVVATFALVVALVGVRFWSYWSSLV